MTLLALILSGDDSACEVLGRVLPASGIAVERLSDVPTALDRLQQQRFDALVVDMDDPAAAAEILAEARRLNSGTAPITIALLAERSSVREILTSGAHFVVYKPLSEESAKAGLRAAVALLKRERRCAQRVQVQAPVELSLPDGRSIEGILLDLSETGMDVLTAEPQALGALLKFHFNLPGSGASIDAHGQVAWALQNGQTGVHFIGLEESTQNDLKTFVQAAVGAGQGGPDETVSHCKLSDLSLGGCYVESDSPFPERSLVDLCVRTGEMAVHTEGMVRVAHPDFGMGVEFPSRTPEQRAQVGNLINFLRNSNSTPELSISPRALTADISQFEHAHPDGAEPDDLEDHLLELLRRGSRMQQGDFLVELRQQRSGETVSAE